MNVIILIAMVEHTTYKVVKTDVSYDFVKEKDEEELIRSSFFTYNTAETLFKKHVESAFIESVLKEVEI